MWFSDKSLTRSLILRSVAACYVMAFASLYTQIPGLYGPHGVYPIHKGNDGRREPFLKKPTLLWHFHDILKLSHEHVLDLFCVIGVALGCGAVLIQGFACSKIPFLILWILYLSLYQIGGVFLWFQWDILLLEFGFICILLAPPFSEDGKSRPWDCLNIELVRWLLFRMMFANGLVKLTSECPSWWSLTAMPLHYESQCIPTPISWFAFNYLPNSFHRFSVAMTFMIEIPMTFLFYAPTTGLRKFAYGQQIMLMVMIMITGNYNFFNLLFITLCVSLSDDSWWSKISGKKRNIFVRFSLACFNMGVIAYLLYLFALWFLGDGLKFEIKFTMHNLKKFIDEAVPVGVIFGLLAICFAISEMLALVLCSIKNGVNVFVKNVAGGIIHLFLACFLFWMSIPVFLNGIGGPEMVKTLSLPWNVEYSNVLDNFHLTNSYGLFRQMTGVGGRPEVVILGSYDKNHWEEIPFQYKPGNLSSMPRYVLPHQPRLDWQMWFIALQGKFHLDNWFVNFCIRLLQGKKDVYNLLDRHSNPFNPNSPPKYIKAVLYHYHFTSLREKQSSSLRDGEPKQWWFRELVDHEFVGVVDEPTLQYYVEKLESRENADAPLSSELFYILKWLRKKTNEFDHHIVVWTISSLFLPLYTKIIFRWNMF